MQLPLVARTRGRSAGTSLERDLLGRAAANCYFFFLYDKTYARDFLSEIKEGEVFLSLSLSICPSTYLSLIL